MIKLSFCIPTYNRANYLKRCIESVLSSNDEDIEIVIQDNCSPDNTEEIVKSFRSDKIKYFKNKENIGGILNAITIIEKAKGDYVFFLTDDDYLLPGSISKLKSFIDNYNPYFFTSDTIMYLEKSNIVSNYRFFDKNIINNDNIADIATIFLSAHILTRVCFKREALDLDFLKQHKDIWYPQMMIVILMHLKGKVLYMAEPTTVHTWENETFWGIEPSNNQILNQSKIKIIEVVKELISYDLLEELIYSLSVSSNYLAENLKILLNNESKKKIGKTILKKNIKKWLEMYKLSFVITLLKKLKILR